MPPPIRLISNAIGRLALISAAAMAPLCTALSSCAQIKRSPMSGFISDQALARGLIRIGNEAIVKENAAMLRTYFAEGFIFHGPAGELTFDQLSDHFASLRAAFSEFRIVREQIIVDGDFVGARNTFSGVFTSVFTQSPVGLLQPTGRRAEWEVINTFRYDADGRLAEEWAQTDNRGLLARLGASGG